MWTDRVGVNPPSFDDELGFFQRVEEFPLEQLIADSLVERFVCDSKRLER